MTRLYSIRVRIMAGFGVLLMLQFGVALAVWRAESGVTLSVAQEGAAETATARVISVRIALRATRLRLGRFLRTGGAAERVSVDEAFAGLDAALRLLGTEREGAKHLVANAAEAREGVAAVVSQTLTRHDAAEELLRPARMNAISALGEAASRSDDPSVVQAAVAILADAIVPFALAQRFAYSDDPADADLAQQSAARLRAALAALPRVGNPTAEVRRLAAVAGAALDSLDPALARMSAAVAARDAELLRLDDLAARAEALVATLIRQIEHERDERRAEAADARQVVRQTVITAAAVAGVLGVSLALLVGRSITRPIRRLAGTMRRLAEGALDEPVPDQARRDEVGSMAIAVAVFKDNAIEKRRLEQAREADRAATEQLHAARDRADARTRAKSEFLATMSHEIRSPISGLVGVLELIRETKLDPDQSRMAKMAHRSSLVLLSVLNDILDFSKIEAGGLTIAPEPTDIRQLVGELAEPCIVAAEHKGVDLTLRFAPEIPPFVLIDPLRLRQILNNLLSNAIKFTAAGTIELDVDVVADGSAPALRFAVHDTGIGMSEEAMTRLFEPFMQADGSTTRNFGGTGLGLCICRRLALLLDGSITVASRLGEGSVFTLLLPLLPAEAPSDESIAHPKLDPRIVAGGGHVLVVDDDPTNRWLAQRRLERLGLAVDIAEDGDMALRMLHAARYDLLLTDCHMPRMDGVALTQALRAAAEPWLRAIPIIGLTADVTADQRDRCLRAGMSDVAIKPLASDALVRLLARHLGNAAPPAAWAEARTAPAAPAGVAGDAPAFDTATYRELFAPGDPEGAEWLAACLSAADALADTLSLQFGGEAGGMLAREAIGETAHRLAGMALSAGATRLGHAARALEQQAARDDAAALRERHGALLEELATARRAVVALMNEPRMATTS